MTDVFAILSDPTRRSIFEAVSLKKRSVGELVELVKIAQSGVSRHLKILQEADFVSVEKDAQKRIYSARSSPYQELEQWLEIHYRKLWENRFNKLSDHLKVIKNEGDEK